MSERGYATSDRALIRQAVQLSGLTVERFAVKLAWRDKRTVTRWLAGRVIPETAARKLRQFVGATDAERARWVAAALAEAE